jgi:hypothetical protein
MAKGFNTRNDELSEKIAEKRQKQAEAMGGGEDHRLKIGDGLNVYWVFPGIGETLEPVVDMLEHFGPYHRCGRTDPVPDNDEDGGYKIDKSFSNCFRCQTAWDHWKATDCAPGIYKETFKNDMENHRAKFQAIDFTPFFKLDSTKRFATSDAKLIKAHLDDFLAIVGVDKSTPEGLKEAKDLVPDDMDDDMAAAALASPGIVSTNKSVGGEVREQCEIKAVEEDEDPLMNPDKYLLQIVRSNEGGTFTGRGGREIKKKEYAVRFTTSSKTKSWKPDADALLEMALEVGVDMENVEPESDSLEDRAIALEKFDKETMKAYLEEMDHSFDPEFDNGGDADEDEGELDPDSFDEDFDDEDVLGTDDMAEAEDIKEELAD